MIVRASSPSYLWLCSIFTSESMVTCQAHVRHVPSTEHHRIVYIRETELFLRCRIISLSVYSRFLFRGRESYSLSTGIFPQNQHNEGTLNQSMQPLLRKQSQKYELQGCKAKQKQKRSHQLELKREKGLENIWNQKQWHESHIEART